MFPGPHPNRLVATRSPHLARIIGACWEACAFAPVPFDESITLIRAMCSGQAFAESVGGSGSRHSNFNDVMIVTTNLGSCFLQRASFNPDKGVGLFSLVI